MSPRLSHGRFRRSNHSTTSHRPGRASRCASGSHELEPALAATDCPPVILSVDVDAVVLREGQADLEFPRQVNLPIERLEISLHPVGPDGPAVQPDFVVSPRSRSKVSGEERGGFLQLTMNAVVMWGRTGH